MSVSSITIFHFSSSLKALCIFSFEKHCVNKAFLSAYLMLGGFVHEGTIMSKLEETAPTKVEAHTRV